MPKNLEEYLSLPYTIVLRKDVRDAIFVARVDELPGCSAHGETEPEALSNLKDNMRVWIEDAIEAGDRIPEPTDEVELPSGKWLQRVPRTLHLKLIRLAKHEGVSLNQFITSVLAEATGEKAAHSSGKVAGLGVAIIGGVDPWLIGSRDFSGEWESQGHSLRECRKLAHSLRSLVRKIPETNVDSTGKGLKRGVEETHEIWNTQPFEVVGR